MPDRVEHLLALRGERLRPALSAVRAALISRYFGGGGRQAFNPALPSTL
jgi:hypothetical protein